MIIDRYYYSRLNESEKSIYRVIYDGVKSHKKIIPLPIKGECPAELFNRVFMAITRDNPLIYYLNQSAYNVAKDNCGHIALCPQYFLSEDKVKHYNHKIQNAVNSLIAQLDLLTATDYEKVKKVHDWMCQNIEYDEKGKDLTDLSRVILSHNIMGVFSHHRAQCEGIAKAVKVLLNSVDVKCIVVTGDAKSQKENGPHAWNIVSIERTPYQLDVTWDIGATSGFKGMVAYDYFNITDELMGMEHYTEDVLPKCNSLEHNYFEKNNLVFKKNSQVLTYIKDSLRTGEKKFQFRVERKVDSEGMIKDILNGIAEFDADHSKNRFKLQYVVNDVTGTYRIDLL